MQAALVFVADSTVYIIPIFAVAPKDACMLK